MWAINLAPAFPRVALTLCPQLCMGTLPRRYTDIGLFWSYTISYDVASGTHLAQLLGDSARAWDDGMSIMLQRINLWKLEAGASTRPHLSSI